MVNIINNAGIGPVTLDDAFFYRGPTPAWPREVWTSIELVLVASTVFWSPFLAALLRNLRRRRAVEISVFAAALTVAGTLAMVQTHQMEVVDRYYMPLILGLAILVPVTLSASLDEHQEPLGRWRVARFVLLLAPIALFSVLGTHDQFRWNDARWTLFERALKRGATPITVQGGYEMNCWFGHLGLVAQFSPCPGGCRCVHQGFCCVDDRWRLGMSVSPGYTSADQIQPSYWLTNGPPVILSKRSAP